MYWQTALGIYPSPQTARSVLKKLRKQGLKRVASIERSHEGLIIREIHGIGAEQLKHFEEWVIRDETLVIVQVHAAQVPLALKILRHVESGHPLSFLLRSPAFVTCATDKEALCKEPLTMEQAEASAHQLASALSKVGISRTRDHPFLTRLDKSERILAEIRRRSHAGYVEQTLISSAEWLLDNTYVIQGNIDEVRRNLPQKILP